MLGTDYSIRFVETDGSGCGPGEQAFHVDSGILPEGLTLAPDGALSGTPTKLGTFRFYVEMREPQDDPAHCAGKRTQKQFTITICRSLAIVPSPAQPPRAEQGVRFRMAFSVCGARGGAHWSVSAGTLPSGLTLHPDGRVGGVPRAAGVYRFSATATDALSQKVNYAGAITVAPALRISRRLAVGTAGRSQRTVLMAQGGVRPLVWKIVRGRLPRGLRLDTAAGLLLGTPRARGSYQATLEVKDGLGAKARAALRIVVLG